MNANLSPNRDLRLGMRFRRVTLKSGDIAYIDEGEGPPVLLLHGAPMTALGFVRVTLPSP